MEHEDLPPDSRITEHPEETSPTVLNKEEKQWAMLAHLSALAGLLVGGFTFLGPLIVWLLKKDESKFVDDQGKEALNFQLNILIYFIVAIGITFATCGFAFPLPLALMAYATIMPIIAGIKANDGKRYEYPLTFRLIK